MSCKCNKTSYFSCSYTKFCVVTRAPWFSASISSKLKCLLYAILMGVSIFLNLFCLIKHAKVILGWLCQTWFLVSQHVGCHANNSIFWKLNELFSLQCNFEYENTEHKSILMVKCLCWMFMLLSFKKKCLAVDLMTNPVCWAVEMLWIVTYSTI